MYACLCLAADSVLCSVLPSGSHYVLLNTIDKSAALHRDCGIKAFLRALPTFAAPRSSDAFLMTVFQR